MKKLPWRAVALFLAVSIAVIVPFALWGGAIDAWLRGAVGRAEENRALVAAILFATLASDILLPVPSSIASALCGMLLGLPLGFAVSFLAMGASAAVGYAIGRYASDAARRLIGGGDMAALQRLQRRSGPLLLLALRPVPVLAEASLVFAGIGRTPVLRALWQVAVGNAIVSFVYAFVGAYFSQRTDASWAAFAVTLAVSGVFMALQRRLAGEPGR